jgi:hypothetical protein
VAVLRVFNILGINNASLAVTILQTRGRQSKILGNYDIYGFYGFRESKPFQSGQPNLPVQVEKNIISPKNPV